MIKRYPFLFIYLIFISGILFILRNGAKLEYEWLLILKDFEKSSEYRIYGVPSAFMPPFYPYFLLLCKKLFSFTSYWESLACVIQATIFFWSVSFFYQIFFRHQDTKKLVCLVAVVFFPPIFLQFVKSAHSLFHCQLLSSSLLRFLRFLFWQKGVIGNIFIFFLVLRVVFICDTNSF